MQIRNEMKRNNTNKNDFNLSNIKNLVREIWISMDGKWKIMQTISVFSVYALYSLQAVCEHFNADKLEDNRRNCYKFMLVIMSNFSFVSPSLLIETLSLTITS